MIYFDSVVRWCIFIIASLTTDTCHANCITLKRRVTAQTASFYKFGVRTRCYQMNHFNCREDTKDEWLTLWAPPHPLSVRVNLATLQRKLIPVSPVSLFQSLPMAHLTIQLIIWLVQSKGVNIWHTDITYHFFPLFNEKPHKTCCLVTKDSTDKEFIFPKNANAHFSEFSLSSPGMGQNAEAIRVY